MERCEWRAVGAASTRGQLAAAIETVPVLALRMSPRHPGAVDVLAVDFRLKNNQSLGIFHPTFRVEEVQLPFVEKMCCIFLNPTILEYTWTPVDARGRLMPKNKESEIPINDHGARRKRNTTLYTPNFRKNVPHILSTN